MRKQNDDLLVSKQEYDHLCGIAQIVAERFAISRWDTLKKIEKKVWSKKEARWLLKGK